MILSWKIHKKYVIITLFKCFFFNTRIFRYFDFYPMCCKMYYYIFGLFTYKRNYRFKHTQNVVYAYVYFLHVPQIWWRMYGKCVSVCVCASSKCEIMCITTHGNTTKTFSRPLCMRVCVCPSKQITGIKNNLQLRSLFMVIAWSWDHYCILVVWSTISTIHLPSVI